MPTSLISSKPYQPRFKHPQSCCFQREWLYGFETPIKTPVIAYFHTTWDSLIILVGNSKEINPLEQSFLTSIVNHPESPEVWLSKINMLNIHTDVCSIRKHKSSPKKNANFLPLFVDEE